MAYDAFLEIETIDGESTDKTHKGEIDIQSFSWGLASAGASSGGGSTGKVAVQDFHFTMPMSKASPKLMLACATGKHIREATLTCRKAGGTQVEFLKIKLSDVLVSSYQTGGDTSEDFPTDQLSLNFVKIDFLYTVARTGEVVEAEFSQQTS
jgi:type VI secretion system secreted protein Hcp